jgi:hypothetical protein
VEDDNEKDTARYCCADDALCSPRRSAILSTRSKLGSCHNFRCDYRDYWCNNRLSTRLWPWSLLRLTATKLYRPLWLVALMFIACTIVFFIFYAIHEYVI